MEYIYFKLPFRIREIVEEYLDYNIYNSLHKPIQDKCVSIIYSLTEMRISHLTPSNIQKRLSPERKESKPTSLCNMYSGMVRTNYLETVTGPGGICLSRRSSLVYDSIHKNRIVGRYDTRRRKVVDDALADELRMRWL
jgi:hypothetical protein